MDHCAYGSKETVSRRLGGGLGGPEYHPVCQIHLRGDECGLEPRVAEEVRAVKVRGEQNPVKAWGLCMFWMFEALRKLRYAHCVIPQGWIALLISLDLHRKRLFNANEKHYAHCRTMSAQTSEDKKGATEKHAFADFWYHLAAEG